MPTFVSMNASPLGTILRPKYLRDIIGQKHLLSEKGPIFKMLKANIFKSMILWGPPGCGKTSIANALATETDSNFYRLNATEATVKDLRKIITEAIKNRGTKYSFVFLDEVHRWNKSQQDVVLPVVEDGTIILIGATTENPKFSVNSTILSRCLVYEAKPLDSQQSIELIIRIKKHYESLNRSIKIDHDAAKAIVNRSSGDARKIVTILETCVEILSEDNTVRLCDVDNAIPHKHIVFDASGSDHYDLAHCYQEAIQNSDPDGAIYWLAKWLSSGEDPAYICRRMLISAFEDCADNPNAWLAATSACYTVERTGLPECMIPMALATAVMAKSDRCKDAFYAIHEAMSDVANNRTIHVPPELRAGTTGYVYAVNKKYFKN